MRVLVLIEERDGVPTGDSLGIVSHVAALGLYVAALVVGPAAEDDLGRLAGAGAQTVYAAALPQEPTCPIEARLALLADLQASAGFDTFLFATSALSVDLAGRLAARLGAGLIWNLSSLTMDDGRLIGRRMARGDTLTALVEWETLLRVGLMRPGAVEPQTLGKADQPLVVQIEAPKPSATGTVEISRSPSLGAPPLASAGIIVAGGRGLRVQENLALVSDLAEALGGVMAVSLPLVDMGWAPRALQVGQTGATVAPQLYIACGISGQYQHKLGMERSGTIIAINIDRDAPIMAFSDLAVVGDLSKILPDLTQLINKRRGSPP